MSKPYIDRWEITLTPPQREPECEKEEARERREKLDVRCDSYLFQRDVVLTPSQREERQKKPEREWKGKEAKGHKGDLKVC